MTRTLIQRIKEELNPAVGKSVASLIKTNSSDQKDVKIFVPTWFYIDGLETFNQDLAFSIHDGVNIVHAASHQGKTTFLNALFYALTGSFDTPRRRISYLCSRIREDSDTLTLRIQFTPTKKEDDSLEMTKLLTKSRKIKLIQLENIKKRQEGAFTSRPLNDMDKIENFLLQSGNFSNKKELDDFYSVFFFNEFQECLLDDKYRGQENGHFLRRFLQKISGQQQAIDIRQQVDDIIRQKTRLLNDYKRTINNMKTVMEITDDNFPMKNETLENLLEEKKKLEAILEDTLRQKKESITEKMSTLNDLIQEKVQIQVKIQQIEDELSRYSSLSSRQKRREQVLCVLCDEYIPKSIIQQRVANDHCPLCGIGSLYINVSDVQNLKEEKARLESILSKIDEQLKQHSSLDVDHVNDLENQIFDIKSSIETLNIRIEMIKRKKDINSLREQLSQKSHQKNELTSELHQWKKARAIIQEEYNMTLRNIITSLNKRFSQLQNAFFDNILVKFSSDLSLKTLGRGKFLDFSQAERKLLEITFRLAMVDVLFMELQKPSFLIIETPEQDLDIDYKEILADMFASYHAVATSKPSDNHVGFRLIISVVDPTFIKLVENKSKELQILPLYQHSTTRSKNQQSSLTHFFST